MPTETNTVRFRSPLYVRSCGALLLFLVAPALASAPATTAVTTTGPVTTVPATTREQALAAMKRATTFIVEKVAYKGGYVWSYTADLSRRWGEMEANKSIMWIQSGTPQVGQLFLDAYHATGDEYYYRAASATGNALIQGQHPAGGWNYIIDPDGEESLKKWYDTVGKNGWRLEEFQHYYGNATFDDSTTTDAARFMLRLYMEKKDPVYKASLDKAIRFVLDSQYAMGGWPQRFPLIPKDQAFKKDGLDDYSGYVTLNDDVASGNIEFLILCYQTLGDKKLLSPIYRGMNSFVILQQPKPQAGWALQYTPDDLKPAAARTYEPKGLATHTTSAAIGHMLTYYTYTGDKQYLARLPEAFDWLDAVVLPANTPGARGSHPTFIEVGTNLPLYIHRTGSNAVSGHYFVDHDPQNTVGHYNSIRTVNTAQLRQRYQQVAAQTPDQVLLSSPLRPDAPSVALPRFTSGGFGGGFGRGFGRGGPAAGNDARILQLINSLNVAGYWSSTLRSTSNPYKGDPPKDPTPGNFVQSNVGDQWDTSPYSGNAGLGISMDTYIANMSTLIRFVDGTQ
jgi:hypothetical protein